jgi:hypothetical protein
MSRYGYFLGIFGMTVFFDHIVFGWNMDPRTDCYAVLEMTIFSLLLCWRNGVSFLFEMISPQCVILELCINNQKKVVIPRIASAIRPGIHNYMGYLEKAMPLKYLGNRPDE